MPFRVSFTTPISCPLRQFAVTLILFLLIIFIFAISFIPPLSVISIADYDISYWLILLLIDARFYCWLVLFLPPPLFSLLFTRDIVFLPAYALHVCAQPPPPISAATPPPFTPPLLLTLFHATMLDSPATMSRHIVTEAPRSCAPRAITDSSSSTTRRQRLFFAVRAPQRSSAAKAAQKRRARGAVRGVCAE